MKKIQWYESLFQNYGERYDSESFTHGTVGECDFMEKELGYNRSVKILDVGCGTGRHSVELAKRGYTVTGVDLSESMLKRAVLKAEKAGVNSCLQHLTDCFLCIIRYRNSCRMPHREMPHLTETIISI